MTGVQTCALRSQISEDKEEAFEMAIDIRRARLQRIKPMASAEASTPPQTPEQTTVVEPLFDEPPELPEDGPTAEQDPATLNPKDRLARWQRKLLTFRCATTYSTSSPARRP